MPAIASTGESGATWRMASLKRFVSWFTPLNIVARKLFCPSTGMPLSAAVTACASGLVRSAGAVP
jgi:hypothetical protein